MSIDEQFDAMEKDFEDLSLKKFMGKQSGIGNHYFKKKAELKKKYIEMSYARKCNCGKQIYYCSGECNEPIDFAKPLRDWLNGIFVTMDEENERRQKLIDSLKHTTVILPK